MKKVITSLILVVTFASIPFSSAAPKSVVSVDISKVATVIDHEGAVINDGGIILFSNDAKKVAVTSLDFTGAEKWELLLEEHADQIAMAATSDKEGNIWLAGLISGASETISAQATAVNIDSVIVETVTPVRADLNTLVLWKVSSEGELTSTFTDSATAPLLINAISHSSTGLWILGDRGSGSILVNASLNGKFSKAKTIGTAKSSLTSIFRNSDGSAQIYGSSAESLGGKALVGRRDGILAKVNKSGSLTTVVRSSANAATRNWLSATSTYFLTGEVKVGGKSESAFTKFNSNFAPVWTLRLPSQTSIAAASGPNGSHFALFNSASAIPRVTGWKPTTPTPLVLRFDAKGVITQALRANQVKTVRAMAHVSGVGLVIVSASGIFRG